MVSYKTMSFIHKRLTEIKGTDDTEVLFGGLNVIAVGDFFQLPPVSDKFVFEDGRGYHQGSRLTLKLIQLTQNETEGRHRIFRNSQPCENRVSDQG